MGRSVARSPNDVEERDDHRHVAARTRRRRLTLWFFLAGAAGPRQGPSGAGTPSMAVDGAIGWPVGERAQHSPVGEPDESGPLLTEAAGPQVA